MDPLTQLLTQRAMAQEPQAQPTIPSVPPASGGQTHTPPAMQRYLTAQKMIEAIRNGWNPNPILTQVASR